MRKVIWALAIVVSMMAIVGCGTGSGNGYAVPRDSDGAGIMDSGSISKGRSDKVDDKVGTYILGSRKNKPISSEELFPVNIAVSRVSYNNAGKSDFRVITTRDLEQQEHYEMLGKMVGVDSIAPINYMMVPEGCSNVTDLCKAAEVLNADMLMVYTLETSNKTKTYDIGPLAAVTLGFTPNRMEYVTSTASAILLDVRTGFVYATFEGSWSNKHNASIWSEYEIRTNLSIDTQQKAFDVLINTIVKAWPEVVSKNKYRVVSSDRSYRNLTMPAAARESETVQRGSGSIENDAIVNDFWK